MILCTDKSTDSIPNEITDGEEAEVIMASSYIKDG